MAQADQPSTTSRRALFAGLLMTPAAVAAMGGNPKPPEGRIWVQVDEKAWGALLRSAAALR